MSRAALRTTAWMIGVNLALLPGVAAAQETWFVDALSCPAAGGGTLDAPFCDLQDALALAEDGDEIHVAQGIYMPADLGGARSATFQLIEGVALRGGYPPGFGEAGIARRRPERFLTVLSGDLDRNDLLYKYPGIGGEALVTCAVESAVAGLAPPGVDNAYHVVTAFDVSSAAVLDGFVITGGNADGPWFPRQNSGAGMFIQEAHPTVTRCRFVGNVAAFDDVGYGCGAALFCLDSSVILNRCAFITNSAGFGLGGGVFAQDSELVFDNCAFAFNDAFVGGGIYGVRGRITVQHCTMVNNAAASAEGQAVYLSYGQLEVTHSILWDANKGAPVIASLGSGVRVSHAVVRGGFDGKRVMDLDPCLVDPDAGDYRLRADSPCIDAGDPGWHPEPGATDAAGHPRLLGACVDLGAYEFGMSGNDSDGDTRRPDLAH